MACDLSLVAPATSALKNPVQVKTSLTDDALTASFTVSSPSINAKRVLAPGAHPYQFDVVEVFASFSDNGFPYFEFEVSPYNQTFQVRIVSKRERHEGIDLGLTSTAEISRGGWTAELKIPLKPLGWDGDPGKVRGNLYSILGPSKKRSYWSTFLPKVAKPDFHRPEYFRSLLQC
jgi:Carbohydrate family 9 binding domain-like